MLAEVNSASASPCRVTTEPYSVFIFLNGGMDIMILTKYLETINTERNVFRRQFCILDLTTKNALFRFFT